MKLFGQFVNYYKLLPWNYTMHRSNVTDFNKWATSLLACLTYISVSRKQATKF